MAETTLLEDFCEAFYGRRTQFRDGIPVHHVPDLADFIELRTNLKFNMNSCTYFPGTATGLGEFIGDTGDIAAFAAVLFTRAYEECKSRLESWRNKGIKEFLKLPETVNPLFFEPYLFEETDRRVLMSDKTRKGAVAMLRRFAETGVIEWRKEEQ